MIDMHKPTVFYYHGFTLIEMVVAMLIVSVLAVSAYARLSKTDTQARITSLNVMKSTLLSVASAAKGYCISQQNCDSAADASQNVTTSIEGRTIYLHYGYPVASQAGQSTGSVAELIQMGKFYLQTETASTLEADFQLADSPNASNCKVHYQLANTNTMPVLNVSMTSSGC